jgi:hypothetical protein
LQLSWEKLKSVTTDGGKNMCDSKTGVVGWICKEMMQVGSETPMAFHCIIHQEALCCQIMSLKDVMDIVTSTVNYIRCNGLTRHQFQLSGRNWNTVWWHLLFGSEMVEQRCSPKEIIFFYLWYEIDIFMTENGKNCTTVITW